MKLTFTLERLLELFIINTEKGMFVWKRAPHKHPQLAGIEAGGPTKGYWLIRVDGERYKRGHLVFFVVNGKWPRPCLDHINGNSLDDRAENLRRATHTQNMWNRKKHTRRLRLPMGVSINRGRYQARICFHRKQIALGTYDTPAEARAIYLHKRRELFGEFA